LYFDQGNASIFDRSNVTISWHSNRDWTSITHLDIFLDGMKIDTNGTPKERLFSLEEMGWHELSVVIRDGRGFTGRSNFSFFCDWKSPEAQLIGQGKWTNDLARFHWNATDNIGIDNIRFEVYNMTRLRLEDIPEYGPEEMFNLTTEGNILVDRNNISLDLPEGNYSFVLIVSDLAGNKAVDSIAVGVDRTDPRILELYPAYEGVGRDTAVWIKVSEYLDPSTITFEINGTSGKWYSRENDTYEFVPHQELDDFTIHNPIFGGEDRAGNRINASWSFITSKDPLKTTTATGRVVDKDGDPLSEVGIYLVDMKMTETSSDGSFTMELREGRYSFNVSKEGYINSTFTLEVPYGGGPLDLGTITMESLEEDEERGDPPYLVFALGIGLILITVIIAISAFTRKGGPLDEE
jgi:hypothetical protein